MLVHDFALFFFLLIADVLLQRFVEFLDPPLNAAEMERSVALRAIPDGTPLVNLVGADCAFLAASA